MGGLRFSFARVDTGFVWGGGRLGSFGGVGSAGKCGGEVAVKGGVGGGGGLVRGDVCGAAGSCLGGSSCGSDIDSFLLILSLFAL